MKTKEEVKALTDKVVEIEAKAATLKADNERMKAEEAERVKGMGAGGFAGRTAGGGSSDEQRAMRAFGCTHVKQLLGVNTGDRKFRGIAPELKSAVRELKRDVDCARFISQMFHGEALDHLGNANESMDRVSRVKGMLDHYHGKNVLAPRLKAFGSTVSGSGDEWVPTLMSNQFIQEFELDFVLENRMKQVAMASNPYDLPTQSGVTKARKIGENVSMTDTTFTTSKLTFTASKTGEYYILPEEMTEDSAPDILAEGRDEVVNAQIRAWESAIINGDNDGTHIDSDTQALGADVAEKLCKGLRRQALANAAAGATVDFGNALPTEALLNSLRRKMKRFGVNSGELILLAGPAVYSSLLELPNVATMDKFGPLATVLKGALAAYQGIPIVISQYMREDLNATGVYDGTTTTRGGLILVHAARWYVGTRRPIRVKVGPDVNQETDRWKLASYQRKDFQGMPQSATEVSVAYGYNVAV